MDERPTLDYSAEGNPSPREPRWRRIVTASILTVITLPCLYAAAGGWYAVVFGDEDIVGGGPFWACIIALPMTWYTFKHWLSVRE